MRMSVRSSAVAAMLLAAMLAFTACAHLNITPRSSTMDTFALKDGDTVVFLGDSITASRAYGEIVERYTLQSYADRRVRFYNAGQGGDTAQGALKRLDRDVLSHKPTVVTVCFGINDIGWGTKASPENIQVYYDGMREITKRCQKAGARVFLLGPVATKLDPKAANETDSGTLSQMSDNVMKIAKEEGATPIPLYSEFQKIEWAIRKTGREKDLPTHAPDGIHLAELGNLSVAYILLKGMGAPDSVSDLVIDASAAPSVKMARRCQVTNLAKTGDTLRFTRLDEGWPIHLGTFAWIHFGYLPTDKKLSQFSLKVTGLSDKSDWYRINLNGEYLSDVTRKDLEQGVNMGYMTPSAFAQFPPWKMQGETIDCLTKARTQLASALANGAIIVPKDKPFSRKLAKDTKCEIDRVEKLQRTTATPRPLAFEIAPTEPPQSDNK